MAITVNILGEDVQLSGNPVEIECTGGSAPANSKNYQILLKIISEDGKLEKFPKTAVVTPNAAGEALFDISGYVDQPVKLAFQYPPSGAGTSYTTQAFNVQVQAGETWMDEDGITQTTWGSISDVFQILKGGVSQLQLNMMRDASSNFYQFYLANGKWLTARPWGDFVHTAQPVKLWFMPIANASATFKVNAMYMDGSEDLYSSAISLNTNNLYEFNCNAVLLGKDAINGDGSKMSFFDVWLEVGGSLISDKRRFTVDWKYCERPNFLLFANSLGGIDDVYLSGYIQDKFNVEGSTAFKRGTRTDTVKDPTIIVTNRQGQNRWTVNTGYKSLTTMQYLRDLLVSKQAWYVYTNVVGANPRIVPIVVENADLVLANRIEDLWDMEITFSEAHTSNFTFDNRSF